MDETYREFLAERRDYILQTVREACQKSGRDESAIEAVAVSKTVAPEHVRQAYEVGWVHFGENRPQELNRKLSALAAYDDMPDMTFDMIGNLQTNKINQVLGKARLIHSVSSVHLAEAISKRALERAGKASVLLEVNISGEMSKSGFTPDEVRASLDNLRALEGLSIQGLMTMAPFGDQAAARKTFCGLRELRDELKPLSGLDLATLSCGMSDDYAIAIEEGSTLIRLGRIVFNGNYFER